VAIECGQAQERVRRLEALLTRAHVPTPDWLLIDEHDQALESEVHQWILNTYTDCVCSRTHRKHVDTIDLTLNTLVFTAAHVRQDETPPVSNTFGGNGPSVDYGNESLLSEASSDGVDENGNSALYASPIKQIQPEVNAAVAKLSTFLHACMQCA
jgi:hypothetical protein